MLAEERDDLYSLLGGVERAAVAFDVADLDEPFDDGCAGCGCADARVLHRLAELCVLDVLAGRLHGPEKRCVRESPRGLGFLPQRLDRSGSRPPRRDQAREGTDRRRSRPRREPSGCRGLLAVDGLPPRLEKNAAARAKHVLLDRRLDARSLEYRLRMEDGRGSGVATRS